MTNESVTEPAAPVRILICGDQPLMRTAMRSLIESEPAMTVVGECANELAAVSHERSTRPDLVLMDIDFGKRCCGVPEQLEELIGAAGAPVLILTEKGYVKCLQCALQHGACGLVMKDRPASVLMRAIRTVLSGEIWIERPTMAAVLRTEPESEIPKGEKLTRREQEVVDLVRLGMSNNRIAERLFISPTTVRHHLASIFGKIGVRSRCELMSYVFLGPQAGENASSLDQN